MLRRLSFVILLLLCPTIRAAEWQYSVKTDQKSGRAFLWIPPNYERVCSTVLGQQVILEARMFQDPAIRATAEKENLALVLVVPAVIGEYDEKGGGAAKLQSILDGLAEISGYDELAQAPLLTVDHSGGAIFAWNTTYWNADRCFGVIGLKSAPIHPPPYAEKVPGNFPAALDDVPVLVVTGQYESWGLPDQDAEYHWRWVRGSLLEFRALGCNALMSALIEPGVTHFGWSDELAHYLAMCIEKAAQRRIPANPPDPELGVRLLKIPTESSWLTDPVFPGPPQHPAAAWPDFKGDPYLAFWHLDEEMARANETYGAARKGKRLQAVTFVDARGKAQQSSWLQSVEAQPLDDGLHFRVTGEFVKVTPPELSILQKQTLGHASGPIRFTVIEGPAENSSANHFEIHSPPPRSKWPVRVTVAAWQAGSAVDPRVCAADPISQSILIHHP